MSQRSAAVELVTPDRAVGEETGHLTHVAYLRKLYGFDQPIPVQYAKWLLRAVTTPLRYSASGLS